MGRPPLISRQRVLSEALRIVDDQGLERLTMRRLGAALGVDPMAVYHHVPDKAALFDGLIELVYSQVELPGWTGDWEVDLRGLAQAVRSAFLAHGNALPLLGTRPPIAEGAFALIEAATAMLLEAGFSEQDAADAVDCTGRLVIGHALTQGGEPPAEEMSGGEQEHADAERSLPRERYPALSAVNQAGVQHDPERLFALALDGLVCSLAQRLQRE